MLSLNKQINQESVNHTFQFNLSLGFVDNAVEARFNRFILLQQSGWSMLIGIGFPVVVGLLKDMLFCIFAFMNGYPLPLMVVGLLWYFTIGVFLVIFLKSISQIISRCHEIMSFEVRTMHRFNGPDNDIVEDDLALNRIHVEKLLSSEDEKVSRVFWYSLIFPMIHIAAIAFFAVTRATPITYRAIMIIELWAKSLIVVIFCVHGVRELLDTNGWGIFVGVWIWLVWLAALFYSFKQKISTFVQREMLMSMVVNEETELVRRNLLIMF